MKYSFFLTNDGTPSLRNLEVDEPYHSKAGAYLEAKAKYSKALKIYEVDNPIIIDMCFGLGYNTAAAIDYLISKNISKATFICFENDVDMLKYINTFEVNTKGFDIVKKVVDLALRGKKEFLINNFKFVFELGDAKKLIKNYFEVADFIFFDPFSPKKDPCMWSLDFIKSNYDALKNNGKIATYSYSRLAKDNFSKANFKLKDGPIIGRRSPSLIGIKSVNI